MSSEFLIIEKSTPLNGTCALEGAKNAVLVIMASLILAPTKSILRNVPASHDMFQMMKLLQELGLEIVFDERQKTLTVDATNLTSYEVNPEIMRKMRASILVMGPLLARLKKAHVALPGGCVIGSRPIDFHVKAFRAMGVETTIDGDYLLAQAPASLKPRTFVLEYPSVGATENIMMAAVHIEGVTRIVNAALEPEVLDLIEVLKKMGAHIECIAPATIIIEGVKELRGVDHSVIPDRLEAGTLLLAASITGGKLTLPDAPAYAMEVFLEKLSEMGHAIEVGDNQRGITLTATHYPKAVSFKTMPYPGFPTDLQAPMMAVLTLASGVSMVHETVFENRLMHVRELQRMGAQITVDGTSATIKGVDELYGAQVIASDIRAAAGLVIAGLAAQGKTAMTGVHHIKRGYAGIEQKLAQLGGSIKYHISEAAA